MADAIVVLVVFALGFGLATVLNRKRNQREVENLAVIRMWEPFIFEYEGGSRTKMVADSWQYDGHSGVSSITADSDFNVRNRR